MIDKQELINHIKESVTNEWLCAAIINLINEVPERNDDNGKQKDDCSITYGN